MAETSQEYELGPLGVYRKPGPETPEPPSVQASDAALEFAGTAKSIAGVLHKPKTFDDKLIHSDIEKGYEADIMLTAAIPYVMDADYVYLLEDSKKAILEFEELKTREPKVPEDEASQATFEEPEDEALRKEWRDYWQLVVEAWRLYGFESAVVESRILTEDDILAWKVMTPFCESLPLKLIETFMAKEGKRAEHGVQNIGSILHREQMAQSDGNALEKLASRMGLGRRK